MSTWIAMAVLAGCAILVIVRPWFSARLPRVLRRRSANITAYRTRLAEIDADHAAGLLSEQSANALKDEQSRRLLDEESGLTADEPEGGSARRGVGLALAVLPVLIAGLWYLQTGSWRTAQQIASGNSVTADNNAALSRITGMVVQLQQHLRTHPDDDKAWAMLGRGETALQHYKESAAAYAKANKLSGSSNPEWLVNEGQSLALSGGRNLQGRPAQLFAQALNIAPDDPRALWYAGLVAAQAGDKARARKLWQTLADQDNVPANVRTALEAEIHHLDTAAPSAVADPQSARNSGSRPSGAVPVTLHLQIKLAPALIAQMPKDATLYVYAKAVNGPPMPLAVQRIQHPELPLKLTLDDSMGVMPSAHLSDFNAWTVGARLSRSGSAQPQSGDLQGQITLNRTQADTPAVITINRRLP